MRQASVSRQTGETRIQVVLTIDGQGRSTVDSGVGFLDHMLCLFARHGYFDLELACQGDLQVDQHHTIEDCGIVLGTAFREALGDKQGIRRYGSFLLPMDEALVRAALDLSGRPYLVYEVATPTPYINGVDTRLFREFWRAFAVALGLNLHLDLIRGDESHHIVEASFKAVARALDQACAREQREQGVPSTKGSLDG